MAAAKPCPLRKLRVHPGGRGLCSRPLFISDVYLAPFPNSYRDYIILNPLHDHFGHVMVHFGLMVVAFSSIIRSWTLKKKTAVS